MSWDQLTAISQEARDLKRQQDQQPPVACPNDGEPLKPGPHGGLYCSFCKYRYGQA